MFDVSGLWVAYDLYLIYLQDCSDVMGADAVQEWVDIIMHALKNPNSPRLSEEPIIGEIIRSLVCFICLLLRF
jgi:hypothetical protein